MFSKLILLYKSQNISVYYDFGKTEIKVKNTYKKLIEVFALESEIDIFINRFL